MTATELLPMLQELSRVEKLYVMQFLVSELAQEEGERFDSAHAYPIWSPYDAHDAADTLLRVLNESNPE